MAKAKETPSAVVSAPTSDVSPVESEGGTDDTSEGGSLTDVTAVKAVKAEKTTKTSDSDESDPFDFSKLDEDGIPTIDDGPVDASGIIDDGVEEPEETPVSAKTEEHVEDATQKKPPAKKVPEPTTPVAPVGEPLVNALELIKTHRDVLVKELSGKQFKLSGEMQEKLADSPEEAVPELLSGLYLDVMQGVIGFITQQIPMIVRSQMASRESETKYTGDFYKAYPALKDDSLTPTVIQYAQALRGIHPKMQDTEFIKLLGDTVSVALGSNGVAKQPLKKSVSSKTQGIKKIASFTPAKGAGTGSPDAVSGNPWENIGSLLQQDFDN